MTRVTLLCGGVGGAKLARGFHLLGDEVHLTVVVNTGDDFEHLGLTICPDVDTVLYTLTGQANRARGWGREDESWTFMRVLKSLGGEDWFQLGDGDLALHLLRTHRLRQGETLSAVTADIAAAWDLAATILPMSDDPVRTMISTDEGLLSFQHYFVARRCEPAARAISFDGAERAGPAPGVLGAIAAADVIAIAPSNPYLSIDPILAVPGIGDALKSAPAPVIAVSPLVGGAAVKGPTTKLMGELGIAVGNESIADHYRDLIDGLLVDGCDVPPTPGPRTATADTMMRDDDDRVRVARAVLAFASTIG